MSITSLYAQWLAAIQALIALLDQEFDALKARDIEQINQCTAHKTILVDQTQAYEQQLLAILNLKTSEQLLEYLRAQGDNVDQLTQLARQAHEKNQRNGMLLQSMIRLNEYGLGILSGKIGQDDTYSASGQLKTVKTNAHITRATV